MLSLSRDFHETFDEIFRENASSAKKIERKKHEHLSHDFQKTIKNAQNVPQWVEINIAPTFSRDF